MSRLRPYLLIAALAAGLGELGRLTQPPDWVLYVGAGLFGLAVGRILDAGTPRPPLEPAPRSESYPIILGVALVLTTVPSALRRADGWRASAARYWSRHAR